LCGERPPGDEAGRLDEAFGQRNKGANQADEDKSDDDPDAKRAE